MKKIIIWIVIGVIAVALGVFAGVDVWLSKQYDYEITAQTADTIIADGYSPNKITVRLTRGGSPVAGHTVNIVVSNGTLRASRLVTDANGEFTIFYYSYLYLNDKLTPLEDVTFSLSDEDNSVLFMIPATYSFTIPAVKSDEVNVWDDWQNLQPGDKTE